MSTLTASRVTTLPRVNLLPPEIAEERRFKKVQAGLGVGVVAALGVVGALVLMANSEVQSAQDELDAATARQATLNAKVKEFAEVPKVYGEVAAARAQMSEAMGDEVRWSYFLNDISLKTPGKVWLTKMTVVQDVSGTATAAAAAPTDTYLTAGIGKVTFEGNGFAHNDVAAWLDALAKQKGLTQPYFTKSETAEIGAESAVTFTSQATITEDALSGRYTSKAGS
jgi:Tfp pilus assembly protein PilN